MREKILAFVCAVSIVISLFLLRSDAQAQAFSAQTIGDYGNITVMEASGNYDAKNPDGSVNTTPRRTVATEFFKTHKDEYDFVVVFTSFNFQMPNSGSKAFYLGVKNDTSGKGTNYSPLDLYLMGMFDKSAVPPMLLIGNPGIDPTQKPSAGVTISGTAKNVTIDDIIAANGERMPSAALSPKSFRTAFILLTLYVPIRSYPRAAELFRSPR